ncbi:MAG: hypothetical protein QOF02_2271 [Blastocatellia bacterium]|jgi:hypothetical protein|nr:hypothetical protein [Blastocatellia bacterium]
MRRQLLIRNFGIGFYLETFLVAAVAAILTIRLFLSLTGYPQLGGSGLHVAHVLWGGLLMMASIIILLSLLGKAAEFLGAITGGIGFGVFIDEVGKFVTSDNDYFFRPSVAIMYVIFILLFMAGRALQTRGGFSSREYLLNALHEMEEVALDNLDEEEQQRALAYLEKSEPANPLVAALKDSLAQANLCERARPGLLARAKVLVRTFYRRIVPSRWFTRALVAFFIGQLIFKLLYVFVLIFFVGLRREQILDYHILGRVAGQMSQLSAFDWAGIWFSLLSGFFVLCGVWSLRRSRLFAYRMFERSILVSIFLSQVFAFYKEQFSALLGLLFNIVILLALRFMIEREKTAAAVASQKVEATIGATTEG